MPIVSGTFFLSPCTRSTILRKVISVNMHLTDAQTKSRNSFAFCRDLNLSVVWHAHFRYYEYWLKSLVNSCSSLELSLPRVSEAKKCIRKRSWKFVIAQAKKFKISSQFVDWVSSCSSCHFFSSLSSYSICDSFGARENSVLAYLFNRSLNNEQRCNQLTNMSHLGASLLCAQQTNPARENITRTIAEMQGNWDGRLQRHTVEVNEEDGSGNN